MVQPTEVIGGKAASCCGQSCLFPLLLFLMKTDRDLLLIHFPRSLPSAKRGSELGKLWNKTGRRSSRTGGTYVLFP